MFIWVEVMLILYFGMLLIFIYVDLYVTIILVLKGFVKKSMFHKKVHLS